MARRWSRVEEDRVASLVDLCAGSTRQLKQVHAHVVANGQSQNNFLAAKLVRAFAEIGILEQARAIANDMCNPNIFVWTALIRGYAFHPQLDNSGSQEALLLYQRLHHGWAAVRPLSFTLSSVLKACSQLQALAEGRQIHVHVFKHGFQIDGRVQTTLINFYGKCDHLQDARKVFDRIASMGKLDIQAWNTMVGKYAEAGDMEFARDLFDIMPERNTHTYIAMITGYATVGKMSVARKAARCSLPLEEKSSVAYTAMITGYARFGDLHAAREMFDELKNRDVASWNAMIAGYAQAGIAEEAVAIFRLMLEAGCLPNQTTIATVASSCALSGCPSLANLLQTYVDGHPTELLNSHTVASLIDLHSKCGDLHKAYDLFCKWKHRDLVCYSTMIAGFGIHGRGGDAINVFNELGKSNLKPDAICFVSLLASCSHSGMVEEGSSTLSL
ncbi:hypothetical protein HPP92_013128 [Vanilla planifolia]|uniref:Pentatricopeptide repeat-containing protein n=1 Tax=Vanilla planifolia TaxID=51239 RepID=A0A835QY37_VANPL|nr:hypothetical protein HPP92_013128 [Vanilla planifolia]